MPSLSKHEGRRLDESGPHDSRFATTRWCAAPTPRIVSGRNQAAKGVDMDEAQFRRRAREQGYGEAQTLEFEPNMANDMHTHDFSAFAYVLSGAFTMVTGDGSVTHQPGEACELAAGTLHAERAGPEGATILIGKK